MSIPYLDYLPCDLTRYSQQVLPAWQAALHGRFQPLREIVIGTMNRPGVLRTLAEIADPL